MFRMTAASMALAAMLVAPAFALGWNRSLHRDPPASLGVE